MSTGMVTYNSQLQTEVSSATQVGIVKVGVPQRGPGQITAAQVGIHEADPIKVQAAPIGVRQAPAD